MHLGREFILNSAQGRKIFRGFILQKSGKKDKTDSKKNSPLWKLNGQFCNMQRIMNVEQMASFQLEMNL